MGKFRCSKGCFRFFRVFCFFLLKYGLDFVIFLSKYRLSIVLPITIPPFVFFCHNIECLLIFLSYLDCFSLFSFKILTVSCFFRSKYWLFLFFSVKISTVNSCSSLRWYFSIWLFLVFFFRWKYQQSIVFAINMNCILYFSATVFSPFYKISSVFCYFLSISTIYCIFPTQYRLSFALAIKYLCYFQSKYWLFRVVSVKVSSILYRLLIVSFININCLLYFSVTILTVKLD